MGRSTYDNHFLGVVGDKVHYKKDGKYHARVRRSEIKASQKEAAKEQRLKFGETGKLAKSVKYCARENFPDAKNWASKFVELNIGCCTVEDLDSKTVSFDYENLKLSEGSLLPPTVSVTYSDADHALSFTVSGDTTNYPGCQADDKVTVILFDAEHRHAIPVELGNRGEGGMKTQTLNALWQKTNLHVYVYAKNAAGDDVSTSTHLTIE